MTYYEDTTLDFQGNSIQAQNFTRFLRSVSRYCILSSEEERDLGLRIKQGDKDAATKLAAANIRFLITASRNYENQGLELSDAIQEGYIGLSIASDNFDVSKGYKFITFASWRIRQKILIALSKNSRFARIPTNYIRKFQYLKKATEELPRSLCREPTITEIVNDINRRIKLYNARQEENKERRGGKKLENIDSYVTEREIMRMHAIDRVLSTDCNLENRDHLRSVDFSDASAILGVDDNLRRRDAESALESILSDLSSKERNILKYYYGIGLDGCSFSLEEVAKMYNITRERVRQIKKNALEKLRNYIKYKRREQSEIALDYFFSGDGKTYTDSELGNEKGCRGFIS